MKKFKTMMAIALVALMAFTVASCGDDNDSKNRYELSGTLTITERGDMTQDMVDGLEGSFEERFVGEYSSDSEAEEKTRQIATIYASQIREKMQGDKTVSFVIALKCTNLSTNKQVVTYFVNYQKGDVTVTNNKNS